IVAWVGSGLSRPAGLPSWSELRDRLCDVLEGKERELDGNGEKKQIAVAKVARQKKDLWAAFTILQRELGAATYCSTIREALVRAVKCPIPENYKLLWKLPLSGIFNLNLDRLATRAHGAVFPGRNVTEFNGKDAGQFAYILKGAAPFIVNLHGTAEDKASWVFTNDELKKLFRNQSYWKFVQACLIVKTILFIGISADDLAVRSHFEALKNEKIDFGEHYWLTDRTDKETDKWAEGAGVRIIAYHSGEDRHQEMEEFFEEIFRYTPEEQQTCPVTMSARIERPPALPDPDEIINEPEESIRRILNAHAADILEKHSEEAYGRYEEFCNKYDRAIYRAWYVTCDEPSNILLGYKLIEEIAEGAFGRVFKAKAPDGEEVAIKLLKQDIRRKPEMLQSFRRGVRSMGILSKHNVEGMILYRETSEIPTFVVMDLVDGPDLGRAVESGNLKDWTIIMRIAVDLAHIIRHAHLLPERVLHRDIRPSNIMLKNCFSDRDNFEVVVLDSS
ncbi:MAG TPA: hypothetical protein ENI73_10345, partial [Spirochaetes bacterium]|nr:hypothetical protein [Spirochaetota bacterium]